MSWRKSEKLMDTIKHYSGFPATGVSLRQMVQFGESPSTGMLPVHCYSNCCSEGIC
jgi:pyruvate dehydrogenase kinase 2/3/4